MSFYTIDIGNTHTSIYEHQDVDTFSNKSVDILSITKDQDPHKIIYSSVKHQLPIELQGINATSVKDLITRENGQIKLFDLVSHYNTNLGSDRLAAIYGASKKFSKKFQVIIDSGTFTTIDFITDNKHLGGTILPGLELIKQCYAQGDLLNTAINLDENDSLWPTSTKCSMAMGLREAYLSPIIRIVDNGISELSIKSPDEGFIICTGGNGSTLIKELKSAIQYSVQIFEEPGLVHMGLLEALKSSMQQNKRKNNE